MHPQDRLFCEIAVQLQLLSREQATRCMQAQEREAGGQSIATVALALGFMDQTAVDSVLHQQQRVLERRREAREASRAQREAESRAAFGVGKGPAPSQAPRAMAPKHPSFSRTAARGDATPTSPSAPARSPRSQGTWSEARQSIDDTRETLDERPPLRSTGHPRGGGRNAESGELAGRQTVPLPPAAPAVHAAEGLLPEPANANGSAALRGAIVSSARGTLLESSGMEQQRRELAAPQRNASGRPIPSGRDWRNPSQPPPPSASFEVELNVQPTAAKLSSRPPVRAAGTRGSVRPPALDAPRYVDRALDLCAQYGASDFHVHTGASPRIRIDGQLHLTASQDPVSAEAAERIVAEVLDDAQRIQLVLDGELRLVYESPSSGVRARVHAFASERGVNLQLHVLPIDVPTPAQLGLGEVLRLLHDRPSGLAICSGPAGSGTTTTLWSLAQALAAERARHIVSLESPLELQLHSGFGLFEQREIRRHVESYADAIAWALAQGADVIVVADLAAPGAFEASLQASGARCLVLGGLRSSGSVAALRRLLDEARGEPESLRSQLAHGLRVLLHQRLLPRLSPPGCIAAFEVLRVGARVSQLIRYGDLLQLTAALEAASPGELVSLRDALTELVRAGAISSEVMHGALAVDRRFSEGVG